MIAALLIELEATMKASGLWAKNPPKAEAFMSAAPFCYDTMPFENWLQYVFIERMQQLLASNQALPTGASISPMAEQMIPEHAAVISIIKKIDKAMS